MQRVLAILIGVAVATLFGVLAVCYLEGPLLPFLRGVYSAMRGLGMSGTWADRFQAEVFIVPIATVGAATTALLLLSKDRRETRCGSCGHLLRGLSRPECPECGQPI